MKRQRWNVGAQILLKIQTHDEIFLPREAEERPKVLEGLQQCHLDR